MSFASVRCLGCMWSPINYPKSTYLLVAIPSLSILSIVRNTTNNSSHVVRKENQVVNGLILYAQMSR